MFLEQGYAAMSMSTLASDLGGSKATLWKHFPSKDALFAAVLDDLTADFRQRLEPALRRGRDIRTTLNTFCEHLLIQLMLPESVELQRLVIGEAERFPEVGKMFFERGPKQLVRKIEEYLAEEVAKGTLQDTGPRQMADHLIGMTQATAYQRRLWNVPIESVAGDGRAAAVAAVDTFMRAYARDPKDAGPSPHHER